MRNRAGTSNINRRKYIKKASSTQSTPQQSPNPSEKIVPASKTVSSAGIVVAAPGAADRAAGKEPESTNLIGGEIKVDEDGRMDLSDIEKMDPLSAGIRGTVVPTEQMVGMAKDVAYGVSAENQKTMESGLDLVLNPLIKPFVDPRMTEAGVVTDSNWYWPEELKSDWKVLPAFMQKGGEGKAPETRSFVEGMGGFFGNVGAVLQSDLANKIRDEEFAISEERFNRSSGTQAYYIGSLLGEVPYMIVGGGQVKAVATISAKAAAGAIRGGVKGTSGLKLIKEAYRVERQAEKLTKTVAKTNKVSDKINDIKTIIKSKDVLIKGLSKNTAVQRKLVDTLQETKKGLSAEETQKIDRYIKKAEDLMESNKNKSNELDKKFGRDTIDDINKIEQPDVRTSEVNKFNSLVKQELLPDMKIFKDEYVAQTLFEKSGSKVERLASLIEGSPGNVSAKVDKFINRPGRAMGDAMTEKADQIFKERILKQAAEGRYSGIMGNVILNKDIWGNVVSSKLGIDRVNSKMNNYAALISRTVPMLREIDSDAYQKIGKTIDEEKQSLTDQNLFLNKQLKLPMDELPKGGDKFEIVSKMNKNLDEIKKLDESKTTMFEPLSYTTEFSKNVSGKGLYAEQTTDYRFDFDAFTRAFPDVADKITSQKIKIGARPDVIIKKVNGMVMGEIGGKKNKDGTVGGYTFWINQMGRKTAATTFGGEKNLSKSKHWTRNIGFRRVGRLRTAIPKRREQTEDIIYMYKADDSLMSTSGKSAAVENIISVGPDMPQRDIDLIKTTYYVEEVDPSDEIAKMFPERKILRYKRIEQEKIQKTVTGLDSGTLSGKAYEQSFVDVRINKLKPEKMKHVGDILRDRALLENRPSQAKDFVEREMDMIRQQKENIWSQFSRSNSDIKKMRGGSLKIDEEKIKLKLYNVEKDATQATNLLDARLTQLRKWDDVKGVTQLQKDIDIHQIGSPRGTIFSMPVETLKREDDLLSKMYESEKIIDNITKKQYYRKGVINKDTGETELKMFEILDTEKFNPAMVSSSDQVMPQLNERQFIQGQVMPDTGKTVTENVPVIPGQSKSTQSLYQDMQENTIFINKPDTYQGILKQLTPTEVAQLESGSNLGRLLSESKDSLLSIDTTPETIKSAVGGTVIAKSTKLQLAKQYAQITLGKTKTGGLQSASDTKIKLENILFGQRFSKMSTQDFRPDSNTYQQRLGKGVGELTQGTSSRVTGYNTKLRAMLGAGDDPELVQGAIPTGVKVNPIYDAMTFLRNSPDLATDIPGKSNKTKSKLTVYQQLLEEAKRKDVEQGFKERMAQLVRMNVEKKKPYNKTELKALFKDNESRYLTEVVLQVNTDKNKYLRLASKKDKKILKGKDKQKKDKIQLIDYNVNFPELDVIDNRNFVKKFVADIKSQRLRAGPEFLEEKIDKVGEVTYDGGKTLPGPNIINRIFRDISRRRDKPGSKILTESPLGAYSTLSMKKVLSNPQIQETIAQNKFWSKMQTQILGATQTADEAAQSRMLKGQEKPKESAIFRGVDIDKLKAYETDEPTAMDFEWDLVDAPGKVGSDSLLSGPDQSKKYKLQKQWDKNNMEIETIRNIPVTFATDPAKNRIKIDKLYDENVKIREKIDALPSYLRGTVSEESVTGADGSVTVKNRKITQERTDAVVKAMINKSLGVSDEATTSVDRSKNSAQMMALVNAGMSEEKINKVFSGSAANTSDSLNKFFATSRGKQLLEDPAFKQTAKTQSDQKTAMSGMSDKVAESLNDRVVGFSAGDIMSRVGNKKPDSIIGFKKQVTTTSTLASNIGSLFGDDIVLQQPTQQEQQDSIWGAAYAESAPSMITPDAPVNVIDQTIGDIQKTLTGIVSGNQKIGSVTSGMTVKSYEAPSTLTNVIGKMDLSQVDIQRQSQPSLLEGLSLGQQQEGGTLLIPRIDSFLDTAQVQSQRQVESFASDIMSPKASEQTLLGKPLIVTPKPVPQRVFPIFGTIPLYNPKEASMNRRSKIKKKKTKKTWWQTPENWYEPYYWGGKNQEGAGYVTFTGREPAKVRKYEKKFFGIGVNDSPFGVRSKWF